ncbi:tyrosine-type recombinase/integrase [Ihubacter sp. rT4E-8]|uniref:tyrosine-type recombinase/integrase n=1 Tax=Ihubacter sp. rT4E-8 TaxID=3242369 RepID=UPI003CF44135
MKPKTERSRRLVPLNATAKNMARLLFAEFPDKDLSIYTANHRIVAPASLNKYLATINRNAGIENKSGVHKLRDTFGSLLFDKGMDLQPVSDLLGHANSRIIEKYYLKILERRKIEAINMIEI